jgi:hypothetical protein
MFKYLSILFYFLQEQKMRAIATLSSIITDIFIDKIHKLSFAIIHSTTIALPAWHKLALLTLAQFTSFPMMSKHAGIQHMTCLLLPLTIVL